MSTLRFIGTITAAALLGSASSAAASDGVAEINQTCAEHTGCFSGDGPGYPVTIDGSAGRSYVLTSDLILAKRDQDGISVAASGISIDLGGFEIRRAECGEEFKDCQYGQGAGAGIRNAGSKFISTTVHDGGVVGMASYGISLGGDANIRNVRARWNTEGGIKAGENSTVSDCHVYDNAGHGIEVSHASIVSGSTVRDNWKNGIYGASGVSVLDNVAWGNYESGISVNLGGTVARNTSRQNRGSGIRALSATSVNGNTVQYNSAYGLDLDPGTVYRDNTVAENVVGQVYNGTERGGNYCGGTGTVSPTCP